MQSMQLGDGNVPTETDEESVPFASRTLVSRRLYEEEISLRQDAEARIMALMNELDEGRKAMERVLQSERELARLRHEFITSISHEFRTPLTKIHGSAYRLEKDLKKNGVAESDKALEQCQVIHDGVESIVKLIEKCLSEKPG